eukprot:1023255-Pelagomonas_calceolata.AAC.7
MVLDNYYSLPQAQLAWSLHEHRSSNTTSPCVKRTAVSPCMTLQEQAVQFLEKVFNAASKYAIKPQPAPAPAGPPPTQQAAPGSPIQIPNMSKMPTSSNLEL